MRPYNTTTPLGRRMWELQLYTYEVCGACKISSRLLTEYLAGRKPISPTNRAYLAKYLKVSEEYLQGPVTSSSAVDA